MPFRPTLLVTAPSHTIGQGHRLTVNLNKALNKREVCSRGRFRYSNYFLNFIRISISTVDSVLRARSVAPVSKPAPAKFNSPIWKAFDLPDLDFWRIRNWASLFGYNHILKNGCHAVLCCLCCVLGSSRLLVLLLFTILSSIHLSMSVNQENKPSTASLNLKIPVKGSAKVATGKRVKQPKPPPKAPKQTKWSAANSNI